ncbi:MAG TPA: hypothetical protein DCX73_11160 [Eubacterium sp.]|nr:hypothetical protein [Eubacterium sp.]
MKRAMYAVIVLWAVLTAVYMTNMGRADKVSISTAFTDSVDGEEWCELDTYIEGYGKFGVCYLTQEEKERLVENIASALGITSSYGLATVCEDEVNITVLSKESVDGSVTIKAITQEPQAQYVYVNITVYNNIDCAVSYRELVEGMFDAMGIQGNVNMNLVGSIEGTLNSTEKNELADGLLDRLGAKVVTENRDNDIFTIYAYSKGAGSYITIGGNKINMNIAIGYDEEQDRTKVYLASPINSLDY